MSFSIVQASPSTRITVSARMFTKKSMRATAGHRRKVLTASEHAAFYPRNGSLAFGVGGHKVDIFSKCCRMLVVNGVGVGPLIVISLLVVISVYCLLLSVQDYRIVVHTRMMPST